MLATFILGLLGSVSHCTGMCSGVALLLGRTSGAYGARVILLHLGRITTYALMGLVAGGLGHALARINPGAVTLPGLSLLQGTLALSAAAMAVYMAMAFLGYTPPPELLLSRITSWWGRTMRRVTAPDALQESSAASYSLRLPNFLSTYFLGLLWGMLPCGLVLMALLLAAVSGSMQQGALAMLLFGIGTWPLVIAVTLAPRMQLFQRRAGSWGRPATAAVILLFGLQMALRGLAAWGWVDHAHLSAVTLW